MRVGLSIETIKRKNQLIHASLLSVTSHECMDSQKPIYLHVASNILTQKWGEKNHKYKRLKFNQQEQTRHAFK